MSAEATGWVFARSPMKGAGFAVHLAIADSVNDQYGYEFWMRMPNLAKKARLSRGAAAKAVATLCDAGLLELVDVGTPGPRHSGSPRRFRMLMPDLPRLVESRAHDARPRAKSRAEDVTPRADDARRRADDATPPLDTSLIGTQGDEKDEGRVEARRLCELLASLMVDNGCRAPSITETWIVDIDRMIRLDGLTPANVENAIRWSQADAFWRGNILSPRKLREKYDQLRLAAKQQQNGHGRAVRTPIADHYQNEFDDAGRLVL